MNTSHRALSAMVAVLALASGAALITSHSWAAPQQGMKMEGEMNRLDTAQDHAAEAAKYDQEARELDAKAKRHADMAKQYQARGGGGSKQATALQSLATHCQRLAKSYTDAAAEAREIAKSHRAMAQPS